MKNAILNYSQPNENVKSILIVTWVLLSVLAFGQRTLVYISVLIGGVSDKAVSGNPLKDMSAMTGVTFVMKSEVIYKD